VQCLSCAAACPFGIILPELLKRTAAACDFCLPRLAPDQDPVCAAGCPENAVRYGEFEEDPARNLFRAGDRLVVHAFAWRPPEGT
jgi:Fe-S-cluster-containing dehydrogenase component